MSSQTLIDNLIIGADKALKTLAGQHHAERKSPAAEVAEASLAEAEKTHAAGLMRVNYAGEVCAQALYEGQALTARDANTRETLLKAAQEEEDHLAWCSERLDALDSRPSLLNPVWYGLSYALGVATGLMGDRVSLGFVAATEEQVCKHLDSHMDSLPETDEKSRAVVVQMRDDERRHGSDALRAGGADLPRPVKDLMSVVSKLMTGSSYRL